jgi:hypothetical protein
MPKYIRRTRTSSNTTSLRDALLRDLEREGEKLLKKMSDQFARDLQSQGDQLLKGLFGQTESSGGRTSAGSAAMPGIGTAVQLVGTLLSYSLNKPRTTTSTRESDRSRDAAASFRVSRAQALAEATAQLSKSQKNL